MIKYVEGDATQPIGDGPKIIAHICNSKGAWGAGFVLAVTKAFGPGPSDMYIDGIARGLKLGETQLVKLNRFPDITIANMMAQVLDYRQGPNIRYEALEKCLKDVAAHAKEIGASVHGPRFGAGLAGGKWRIIEPIILDALKDVDITIYDYNGPGAIRWGD